jgi:alpha-beta hydrolase superfamily lysophospholipase
MRENIEFPTSDGTLLRGWHYAAEGRTGPAPTIAMAHGFSAVKEMYLDRFAEVFAAAGLACLVFDNRGFGASDGAPRQEADPLQQIRDYRDAITVAQSLPGTDPARISLTSARHRCSCWWPTTMSSPSPTSPSKPTLARWSPSISSP